MTNTPATALRFSSILISILSIFITSSAQNYQWKSLQMGGAGFVSGIITSKQEPNLMYCRTDVGGAYKWNNATSTWAPLLDWASATQSGFYGVESIAIDPNATNKVYMYVGINYFDAGKTAILKSDDYGATFTTIDVTSQFKAHGNGAGRSNGERLQVDPNLGSTLYVGTRANGLFRSIDAGLTWNRLNGLNITTTPNGNGISFVMVDPSSGSNGVASQTIYAGVSRYSSIGDNLFKSTDGGTTFNPVTGGPAAYMPQRAVRNSNGDLIINFANGAGPGGNTSITPTEPMNDGGIFKYTSSTGVWTNITPSGIVKAWGGITVDPNNPNRMMASTINNYQFQYATPGPPGTGAYGDRIYLTTNGGTSWTDVVSRGFNLNTNGISWIYSQAIHWAGSVEFDPFNTNRVFITSGNGVFSNNNIDDATTQWKFEVKGLEETVPTDIASLPGGPLFTTIGDYDGFKFTDINQYGEIYNPRMGTTTGFVYAGNNTNFVIRVGSKIYYSTDQGVTWTATPIINGSQGKITVTANATSIVHCPNGSSTIYSSIDNGATWTTATNTAGGAAFNLSNAIPVADKVNTNKVYLYNNGSGNFSMSNTGGATFTVMVNIGSGGSKLIRTIPGMEGHIWVALSGGGLKRSINSGTSFTTIAGVTACSSIGYGKAAPGATYLTLYMWGTVGGITGLYKSINEGASWVRLNDDVHQFGGPGNAQFVMGDMNTYGNVYMSTVGRGVIAGVDISNPVAVSLANFTVRGMDQGGRKFAELTWNTASEYNAAYFDIERSTNGTTWIQLNSVLSKSINGNSSSALNYNYADDVTGLNGTVYYRLKMVDKNGRAVYSSINSLRLRDANKFLITILSNPVDAKRPIDIRITSDKAQAVIIKIVGINGVTLYSKTVTLSIGSTNINLPGLENKPSGVYMLNVVSAENKKTLASAKIIIE